MLDDEFNDDFDKLRQTLMKLMKRKLEEDEVAEYRPSHRQCIDNVGA